MRIAELFRSRQGEGQLVGTESVFVRTSGCNLRCWFCDTPYASWRPEGENRTVDEIVQQVERVENAARRKEDRDTRPHVVLTGGEPMLHAELVPLCQRLHAAGWHITIETAGTCYLQLPCDLMSISPKLSRSGPSPEREPVWAERHRQGRDVPAVIRRLVAEYAYQVKFVVDSPADCEEVEAYLARFPEIDRGRAMLMPQGTDRAGLEEKGRWLEPYCAQRGLLYCPRRQIEWYGLTRGT